MGWACVPDGGQPPAKASSYSEPRNAPRPIGRPKLRFQDVLKRDLNAFSITSTSWEKLACNKREWNSAIETGKYTSKNHSWKIVSAAVLIVAHDGIDLDDMQRGSTVF